MLIKTVLTRARPYEFSLKWSYQGLSVGAAPSTYWVTNIGFNLPLRSCRESASNVEELCTTEALVKMAGILQIAHLVNTIHG